MIRKCIVKVSGCKMRMRSRRSNPEVIHRNIQIQTYRRLETNTFRITQLIRKYFELFDARDSNNQNMQNAIADLELLIITKIQQLDDEEIRSIIDCSSPESLRDLASTGLEHREDRVAYIESKVKLLCLNKGSARCTKEGALQKFYSEDPSRCLRWHITGDTTASCPIPMTTLEEHFSDVWSDANSYCQSDEWALPRLVNEEDAKLMEESILSLKKIKDVITSRDPNSAAGLDSISFGVIQTCPEEMSRFLQLILRTMMKENVVPSQWKTTRTILIFKKGDPSSPTNWRPLSISSSFYRIVMLQFANAIKLINQDKHLLSPEQKGFKEGCSGCSEHVALANELVQHAIRSKESLLVASTDFSNAFGSVSHRHILNVLEELGFPCWMIKIIKETYIGSTTRIETDGKVSSTLFIHKGVRQGCPLSPLLFNLCLEPLIRRINNTGDRFVTKIQPDPESPHTINCGIQAYADDVLLFSNTEKGLKELLDITNEFCQYTGMSLAAHKCSILSSIVEGNFRRQSDESFLVNGNVIPLLPLNGNLEYLGTSVALRM